MSKNQPSLQIPALESLQVNFNCFNPDNICFEDKKKQPQEQRS